MVNCHYCKKEIDEKKEFCELISHSDGKISNKDSWHKECWKLEWEEKMNKKVEDYSKKILKKAQPLINNQFGGGLGFFH
jgi:hypothetical protein